MEDHDDIFVAERKRSKFALFPHYTVSGRRYWLEWMHVEEEWWLMRHSWVVVRINGEEAK